MSTKAMPVLLTVLLVLASAAPAVSRAQAAASHPDFTGLWKIANPELVVKPEDDASGLTDEALRRRRLLQSDYDLKRDDPNNFCVVHGMPWIMLSRARDYVFDIYQTKTRIIILFEGMDWRRLIDLEPHPLPDSYLPGTNGHSEARWQGNELVVTTDHLRATPEVGPFQRSDKMHVVERWRLVRHSRYGKALEVRMEVTDPLIYRGTAHGYQLFVPAAPGSVLNEYGCTETLFEQHLEELAARRSSAQAR